MMRKTIYSGFFLAIVAAGTFVALAQPKPPVAPAAPAAPAAAPATPAAPAAKAAELPPVSSVPQSTTASFADWVLRCRRIEGAPGNPTSCEVAQTLQVQGQGTVAEIAFGRPPGKDFTTKEPMRVVVVLPNNIVFPGPVLMSVDDKDKPVELSFRRCLPSGCFADAEAKDDVVARWRAQNERGRIAYKDGSGRDIALPFSFRGLTQALDAMAKL